MQVSKLIKHAAFVVGTAVAVPALAADPLPGMYVGGGIMEGKFEIDGVDGDANPTALFARAGYQVNPYLAAEARLGTGFDSDKFHGIKTEIENFYGIYAKVGLPTAVGLYPYAMVGLTQGELKASYGSFSDKQDESDVSMGFGLEYLFDRNFSVGLEYMKYMDTSDFEFSGISLGGNYKF